MFCFETVRIILKSIFSQKIKQHLAMLAIQNRKALWRKNQQCHAKDVKCKTKTASHVKTAKSKSRTTGAMPSDFSLDLVNFGMT